MPLKWESQGSNPGVVAFLYISGPRGHQEKRKKDALAVSTWITNAILVDQAKYQPSPTAKMASCSRTEPRPYLSKKKKKDFFSGAL